MKRSNIVLAVMIALIAGALFFLSRFFGRNSDYLDWQFQYEYHEEKLAYDRDFFIDFLEKDIGKSNFHRLGERFSQTIDSSNAGLYLYYNSNYPVDEVEAFAMLDYVRKGNNALVISHTFGGPLYDYLVELNAYRENSNFYNYSANIDSAIILIDTVSLFGQKTVESEVVVYGADRPFNYKFEIAPENRIILEEGSWEVIEEEDDLEEEAYDDNEYSDEEDYVDEEYDWYTNANRYEDFPTPKYEVIGRVNDSINLVKVKVGEGYLYLHCSPVLFTNAQLDKKDVFGYCQKLFEDIEYTDIYYDELKYQFLNREDSGHGRADQSYFMYIYKNKALKWAFVFLLVGVLVFLLTGIKRKRKAIEVVEPLTNSSIEFSKTIARLYWLNPNHKRMAEQKMKMFLFEVRKRYGLPTHTLNEDFKERFIAKTGLTGKYVNRLFDAYRVAQQSETIHRDLLIQISDAIVYIRQHWK